MINYEQKMVNIDVYNVFDLISDACDSIEQIFFEKKLSFEQIEMSNTLKKFVFTLYFCVN